MPEMPNVTKTYICHYIFSKVPQKVTFTFTSIIEVKLAFSRNFG